MKKKNQEMKSMSNLGIANVWPEMAYGKDWKDVPITAGYVVSEKGKQELARWHQRKRNSKIIAYIVTFILLVIAYYACFVLRLFG